MYVDMCVPHICGYRSNTLVIVWNRCTWLQFSGWPVDVTISAVMFADLELTLNFILPEVLKMNLSNVPVNLL